MNIVHIDDFERARKGFSSQEAVGLLRECRELTLRTLSAALVRMMGKVDDALFELAEKAENNAVQSLYFDAMREVRLKRASMEIGFKAQLMEGFNREIRKEHEAADAATMPAWKLARESGGGVLIDIGSHAFDFARWLLGVDVEAVEECAIRSVRSEGDEARLTLRMAGGVRAELVHSYLQGRKHRWEVEGTAGVLRAERWPARLSRHRRVAPGGPSRIATSLRALPIPRREPSFGRALREFTGAALGGAHDLPTIADGRRSLEVVLEAESRAR